MATETETETELRARLTAIRRARDSGVLVVRHGEVSTTYKSTAEMDSIIADLVGRIRAMTGTPRAPRYVTQKTRGL